MLLILFFIFIILLLFFALNCVFFCLGYCICSGPPRKSYPQSKLDYIEPTPEERKTATINLAFYPTINTPKPRKSLKKTKCYMMLYTFHKYVMRYMKAVGFEYGHVELIDDSNRFWGIYAFESIHIKKKKDEALEVNVHFHFKTTPEKKRKVYDFLRSKEKVGKFNYSIYLITHRLYLGKDRYFCSELIAEAFKYADILDSRQWIPSHKITPDKLHEYMSEALGNDNPNVRKKRLKKYKINLVIDKKEYKNFDENNDDEDIYDKYEEYSDDE